LEALKQQEELIEEELAQETAAAESKKKQELSESKENVASDTRLDEKQNSGNPESKEVSKSTESKSDTGASEEVHLSAEQAKELGEAIKVLVSRSAVETERSELESLKGDRAGQKQFNEKVLSAESSQDQIDVTSPAPQKVDSNPPTSIDKRIELGQVDMKTQSPSAKVDATITEPKEEAEARKAAELLTETTIKIDSQVDRLIEKITSELQEYDDEIGSKLQVLRANEQGLVRVSDLEEALKLIRSRPANDTELKALVRKLDKDGDGLITMHELLQVGDLNENETGSGSGHSNSSKLS
jgi:LETM1 and EF-hand domain-containing protein 1